MHPLVWVRDLLWRLLSAVVMPAEAQSVGGVRRNVRKPKALRDRGSRQRYLQQQGQRRKEPAQAADFRFASKWERSHRVCAHRNETDQR
jgi:hypothetical protein